MVDRIVKKIEFEIQQVDRLLEQYADLLERPQERESDLVETTALASVLHSFYNGLENIFLAIAKGVDGQVPAGSQWHRDLLSQMTQATSQRQPVLSDQTAQQLADYLGFRHFYRHSYSFVLDWNEMESLIVSLEAVWEQTKSEILLFIRDWNSEDGDSDV